MTRVPLEKQLAIRERAREEPADHDAPDRLGPSLRPCSGSGRSLAGPLLLEW